MKLKLRRASNEPMSTVVREVEVNTIEDLIALEKGEGNPIVLTEYFADPEGEYSLLVYDDYLE